MLDEQALLTAMTYVDLNPVLAGLAETPETSDYTSDSGARRRVAGGGGIRSWLTGDPNRHRPCRDTRWREATTGSRDQVLPQAPLMPFDATAQTPWTVPFAFEDYLDLVDWTGRALRVDKPGYIEVRAPTILAQLGIDGERLIGSAERLLQEFGTAVGALASLTDLCAWRQAKYLRGIQAARAMFVTKQAT